MVDNIFENMSQDFSYDTELGSRIDVTEAVDNDPFLGLNNLLTEEEKEEPLNVQPQDELSPVGTKEDTQSLESKGEEGVAGIVNNFEQLKQENPKELDNKLIKEISAIGQKGVLEEGRLPENITEEQKSAYMEIYHGLKDKPGLDASLTRGGLLVAEAFSIKDDMAKQVWGGARDATQELINSVDSLSDWARINFAELMGQDDENIKEKYQTKRLDNVLPEVKRSNRTAGQITRGMSQFLTGFIPVFSQLKMIQNPATRGVIAAAATDAFAFDPHEERLSNFIQQYPQLQNPVTEYLSADPKDTEIEGRFKNVLEGLGIDAALGGAFVAATKAVKFSKKLKKDTTVQAESEKIETDLGLEKAEQPVPIYDNKKDALTVTEESEISETVKTIKTIKTVKEIKTTEADIEAIDSIKVKAGDKALNINPARIIDEKDLQNLLVKVADFYPGFKDLDKVQTNKQTRELADKVGLSVEDLLTRREGQAFNAAELVAANDILNSSLKNIKGLAKKVHRPDVSDVDRIAFRKAMDLHAAIQLQVSGLKKEAGRALQAGNIQATTKRKQMIAMKDMIENRGGYGSINDMAARVLDLDNPNKLHDFVRRNHKSNGFDMISELFIANILSGPSTQILNITSTTSHLALQIPERALAGVLGKFTRGEKGVEIQEALAMLQALPKGFENGLVVAREIWKTEGLLDPVSKLQGIDRRAITANNLSRTFLGKYTIDPVLKSLNAKTLKQDGIAGHFVNGLGTLLRGISTRPLFTMDGFFKGMSGVMQMQAQAYRKGIQEGLVGKELDERINSLLLNPTDDMDISAKEFAEEVTFTEPNKYARGISQLTREVPVAKLAVPFVNTLANIIRQTLVRTPVGVLSPQVRADLSGVNGKVVADIAKSKMVMGTSLLWMGVLASQNGKITGGMPVDPELRRAALDANFQPYSFMFEDKNGVKEYIPFESIEPIGPLFGIGADLGQIIHGLDDKEAEVLIQEAAGSFYNHITSKFWVASVAETFEALKNPVKGGKKMQGLIASLAVPNLINKINQQIDPYIKAPEGVWDNIKSRLPGASEDVTLRRNFFGQPIRRRFVYNDEDGQVDAVNMLMPGYRETENPDGVIQFIYDNKIELKMPPKTFSKNNATIKLNEQEYNDRLRVQGEVLKPALDQLIESPMFQNGTDGPGGSKALLIKKAITRVRSNPELESRWLQEHPEVFERWMLEAEKVQQQLTGAAQ